VFWPNLDGETVGVTTVSATRVGPIQVEPASKTPR
jgi:hypothetical protein